MTTFERFEGRLPAMLEDLAVPRLPDYADDLFARTAATRQRPGWTFPERWFPMSAITRRFAATAPPVQWRLGLFVVLLALAAILALLLVGSRNLRAAPPFGPAANGGIAYVSAGDIYVGDPVTGTSRLLVGGADNDRFPVFSPDGTHVLFVRDLPGTGDLQINLYVVRADGADLRRITPDALRDAEVPEVGWTPDSRHLAVIHAINGVNQLWLMDATGSGSVQPLSAAAGLETFAFRPPSGHEILFRIGGAEGDPKRGLYAMNADGTNARMLAGIVGTDDSLDLSDATYSPDGSHIYFNHWTSDASAGSPGCCQLYVMNADGSNVRELVANSGASWDGEAAISPDGTKIAFWHNTNGAADHGVFVVKADGTGPIVETGPVIQGCCWDWAPDSSKILMYPKNASGTHAYLLDPGGGASTTVAWVSTEDVNWQRLAP